MSTLRDVPFAKMTGSGNDFVFFDARTIDRERLVLPEVIQAICNRHNGIGADGIVILEARPQATPTGHDAEIRPAQVTIAYFNSDGTPADLCGNATLCSTVMSVELGLVHGNAMQLATPAGLISSRLTDGMPEIDLQPVDQITTASSALGSPWRVSRTWWCSARTRMPLRSPPADRTCAGIPPWGPLGRTSIGCHPELTGRGATGPLSGAWKGRPWRAARAPSPRPSCCPRGEWPDRQYAYSQAPGGS